MAVSLDSLTGKIDINPSEVGSASTLPSVIRLPRIYDETNDNLHILQLAVLLALIITVDVSAQIRFAGDNNGLSVNGKTIDTGNLHESLFNIAEILSATSDSFGFQVFADGASSDAGQN